MEKDEIKNLEELRQAREKLKQQEVILKNTISHQVLHTVDSARNSFSQITPNVNTQKMVQMGIIGYSILRQIVTYRKMASASKQKKKQSSWMKLIQTVLGILLRR